jgi:hypothetical protein
MYLRYEGDCVLTLDDSLSLAIYESKIEMWLDRDPINVSLLCFFTLLPFRYGFSHLSPIDRLFARSGRSGSVMQ